MRKKDDNLTGWDLREWKEIPIEWDEDPIEWENDLTDWINESLEWDYEQITNANLYTQKI